MPPRKKTATEGEVTLEEQTANQEPTKLRYAQDGSVLPPAGFGGPVVNESAEDAPPSAAIVDRSLDSQPRQEFGDPSGYAHKVWAPDAARPEDEIETAGADSEEDEDDAGSDD